MSNSMVDSTDIAAARLALLAVRMSLPPSARGDTTFVILDTNVGPITPRQAEEAMARMPKPLVCTPTVSAHALVVNCVPPTDRRARSHQVFLTVLDSGRGVGILTTLAGSASVMVRAGEDARVVRARAVTRWLRDYLLPLGVAVSGNPAEGQETDQGVEFVVKISRPGSVPIDSLPPDLRAIPRPPD